MSKINIGLVVRNEKPFFEITGSFDEILRNRRLQGFLSRVRCISENSSLFIPFREEEKVPRLRDIQKAFESHNYIVEQSSEVESNLQAFTREEEQFEEFSRNASLIRNDLIEDDSEISNKYKKFIDLYTTKLASRKLYPMQELSAFHMAFAQNSCNFAVPGAGKTSIVYAAYSYLKSLPATDDKHVDNLLVIGPLSSFQPWKEEYEACFGHEPEVFSLSGNPDISKGDKEDYLWSSNAPAEITLIFHGSVDTFQSDLIVFLKRNKTMVVVDEAHRIKNPDGVWGGSVVKISEEARSRIVLTGTPTPNGYQDIYNLYKFIYPYKYREIIGFHYQNLFELTQNSDPENSEVQQLKKNLEPFFIRIKKLDLEKYMNLPKIVEKEIMVEMDSEQRNIYENILDTYVPMFTRNNSASIRDILNRARLIRLRQAASNPKLLLHSLQNSLESDNFDEGMDLNSNFVEESENFLSDSEIFTQLKQYSDTTIPNKFKETLNLLINEIFARNEKVIIWTIFIQNAKQLIDYLTEHEIRAKLLIGETPLDERVSIIKKFNNPLNMDFSVVVANPFSVSESISLHMGCRNAIYFERDYNCAMFIQSRDRIHRVGLTKDQKPNYYYLISNDSIDEVIDNRLKEKVERMEKLINDDIPLFSRVDDTDETEIVKGVLKQYDDSL